jgi:hypothetical protein
MKQYIGIIAEDEGTVHVAFIPQCFVFGHPPYIEGDEYHIWVPNDNLPEVSDKAAWEKIIGMDLREFPEA